MDKLLLPAQQPNAQWMRNEGLRFLISGDNADYFAEQVLLVSKFSIENYQNACREAYKILMTAAQEVVNRRRWRAVGVPQNAERLIEYSMKFRQNDHLLGRFDFAGGIETDDIKLIEFNADTFSLLPETAKVQSQILQQTNSNLHVAYNQLHEMLVRQFKNLLQANPDKYPHLLLSWMGYEEDFLNLKIIGEAARVAGFQEIEYAEVEKVTFSEDEGIFLEVRRDEFVKFDFWYKLAPWDILAHDEPELMEILTKIVLNGEAVIINPAHTMLLQSKGLLKVAWELFPNHPLLLPTASESFEFSDNKYVEKPIFGRVGDNVKVFTGNFKPAQANDGDYGDFPKIFQKYTSLETDSEGYRYQPSAFAVGGSGEMAAFCMRRQEDFIIDDNAEFIATARLVE